MTKKVGSAGRFGAKYGRRIREVIKTIEEKKMKKHPCPSCKRETLRRVAAGIWECKKCGAKFAGGAYEFKTE